MKLFISYRSLDSAKVDTIVARLKSLKQANNTPLYTTWQDKTGIPDGHDWWEAIVDAIIDCDLFIYMVSRQSANNINCRAELSYAYKRNRPILPLVLENEFAFNPISGKNDIDYWKDIPDELNDIRAQFLFYEGTSFVNRIQESITHFQREPQRWRDIPADRPPDPRHASEATNNTAVLYDEACDYAWRLEISTAERLFQKLVRMNDPDFGEDAHEWILLLREYQKLLTFDAHVSTRHKVQSNWLTYKQKFPKPFIELFDPKDFKTRYEKVVVTSNPQASVVTTSYQPTNTKSSLPTLRSSEMPDVMAILPDPFDWIEIPAGKVALTNTWDHNIDVYLKRGVSRTFTVPAFAIAKYPVTNAQFAKFIEAKGYENKNWWTDAGWQQKQKEKWTEPRYRNDKQWNGALQPVMGVSWYEAIAFCNWLNDAVGTASMPSAPQITLPTEQQWQRAAQGDDGRIYPWGNDWDGERCNNNVEGKDSGETTPVTQYEGKDKGDSYFGVVDMGGNVWEWCRTAYETGSQDFDGTDFRVLRGGSSGSSFTNNFRVDYRNRDRPNFGEKLRGFRLVLA